LEEELLQKLQLLKEHQQKEGLQLFQPHQKLLQIFDK
jgi:hypothetical protein